MLLHSGPSNMVITFIWLFIWCQVTSAQLRDESGLLNVFEVSSIANNLCESELKIHQYMKNPFLGNVISNVLKFRIPLLPGPDKSSVIKVFELFEEIVGDIEQKLTAFLEGKIIKIDEAYYNHPNHTNIELLDILALTDFFCKSTQLWYAVVQTKASDFLGLWHIRLPIPDFSHKFQLIKALDFLDLMGIPDRIRRLFAGRLGVSTTTTTHTPSFLETLLGGNKKTTTTTTTKPKPVQQGFLGSLFGRHTTSTTTTTTTTEAPTTTKKASGFLSGLFGGKSETTIGFPSDEPVKETFEDNEIINSAIQNGEQQTTTKRPHGLMGGLLGIKKPLEISPNEISHKISPIESKGNMNNLIGHKKFTDETTTTKSNNLIKTTITNEENQNSLTSKKPNRFMAGLFAREKHTTNYIKSSTIKHHEVTSKKPNGFFSRRKHSTINQILTTKKPHGFFNSKKKSTNSDESIATLPKNNPKNKNNKIDNKRTTSELKTTTVIPFDSHHHKTEEITTKKHYNYFGILFGRRKHTTTTIKPKISIVTPPIQQSTNTKSTNSPKKLTSVIISEEKHKIHIFHLPKISNGHKNSKKSTTIDKKETTITTTPFNSEETMKQILQEIGEMT